MPRDSQCSTKRLIVAVSLVVSLLTLLSMMKIWIGAFWAPAAEAPEGVPHPVGRAGGPLLMIVPTVALALGSLAIAAAAGPLYELAQRTAADLLAPAAYRHAEGYWYGLSLRARPIMYAPKRVKSEQLSTYEALADPQWKSRVCVRSSSSSVDFWV